RAQKRKGAIPKPKTKETLARARAQAITSRLPRKKTTNHAKKLLPLPTAASRMTRTNPNLPAAARTSPTRREVRPAINRAAAAREEANVPIVPAPARPVRIPLQTKAADRLHRRAKAKLPTKGATRSPQANRWTTPSLRAKAPAPRARPATNN